MDNMIRVKLTYEKKCVVLETGEAYVDIPEGGTLMDVYHKAYNLEHTERLARRIEELEPASWEFSYVKPEEMNDAEPKGPTR